MLGNMIRIERITIAVTKMEDMIKFYNIMFKSKLHQIGDSGMYLGKFFDFELLLCSNEFVGIKAEKNRQQFRIVVDNLNGTIAKCIESGGKKYGEIIERENMRIGGSVDPDGNSFEFICYTN